VRLSDKAGAEITGIIAAKKYPSGRNTRRGASH
jgi:hypothetical protein